MEPAIYFRKLFEDGHKTRWRDRLFTSFHRHGPPPEWRPCVGPNPLGVNALPTATYWGRGQSSEAAKLKFIELCTGPAARPLDDLESDDEWAVAEQAGVFACTTPAAAYWYGNGPAAGDDRMVAFLGVRLGPGPDFDTVIARVIETIGEPMTPDQFVEEYCGGEDPAEPDAGHTDNTDPIVLIGDNEEKSEA